jgi:alpha-mannosidase
LSSSPRKAFLVSHTHWDREWYQTFNRFRVNLMEVVDRVLDALDNDPEFRHFVLDGQSAVMEDYLEAAPHQRDRVNRLVREGRLSVGPWYILPDEFLVSGEATVRNLIFGRKAAPLHRVQKVGYMPDSFGHLAQIPQILQLAGIDSFIFTRGMGAEAEDPGWLFRWAAPDGSEVLAVNQCDGYCNAGGLGFAEIWHAHTQRTPDPARAVAKITELFSKMSNRTGWNPALLNNGCDHFPPQQEFAAILSALRENWPETTFHHGSFDDFLEAVREDEPDDERTLVTGELLGGRDHLILSGVWSARMPLKQQNEECQNLLTRYVEPLAAAGLFQHGHAWPGGLFDTAWKELLRNHPHDSICGWPSTRTWTRASPRSGRRPNNTCPAS